MIRAAQPGDLPQILAVYAAAREFMARTGNPTQWGNTHPPEELVREDVARGRLYVLEEENGIHGVFMFSLGEDPTYREIQGAWLSDAPYGTIHRVAGDGQVRGLLAQAIRFCAGHIGHLRIDTHENNRVMRHLLEKNGFSYRGIIRLADGSPRLAFERE